MKRRSFLSALLALPATAVAAPALASVADVEPVKLTYAPRTDFSGAHTHTLTLSALPVHTHSYFSPNLPDLAHTHSVAVPCDSGWLIRSGF